MFCVPGGCGGDEFGGDVHRYYLIVEFDSNDLVRRVVVVTDRDSCNDDKSVCFDDGELKIVEESNTLLLALEYDIAKTPCAFLLSDIGHESNGFLGELLALPGAQCDPVLAIRNSLVYAFEATEPYTGMLTVSGIGRIGRLERSYERGKLNGAEIAWSESGAKLYEANYRDNLLHGPVTFWKPNGEASIKLCFENGDVNFRNGDDCD